MSGKRVADAFVEIKALKQNIRKLRFAIVTTAIGLLTSVSTLTYIISQIQ